LIRPRCVVDQTEARSLAAETVGRRSGRCCASTSSASPLPPSASAPLGTSRSSPQASRSTGSRTGGGSPDPRRCRPHPCWEVPVRGGLRGSAHSAGLGRQLDQSPLPGTGRRPSEVPQVLPSGLGSPGLAGRPMATRRVCPGGDEHRQSGDLRRDDRLRALRVHKRLRPGHGSRTARRRR
jgi:hypothetical protein